MSLQIYNTQTRKKELFTPVHEGEVRMYVCGPTVYDLLHVGNFRGAIVFNLVRNWLERRGYKVSYIYNYTDVDDKIIKRANDDGIEPSEIAERYIKEFEKDYNSLKLRPHTRNPRVTEFMDNIIEFIKTLVEKDVAYVAEDSVYYDVHAFPTYGKLSNKDLKELEAGARIDIEEHKKHPADFALWKKAKPGEPSWPSPWGEGRPGWHIECSAMATTLLGETIDIHGGGLDLVFPHHENEIAQSEGCTGKPFVRYWMHNNMLEFGKQKMSKSLGNVRTARSFMEEYNPEILKYMMTASHYRSLIDFSEPQIDQCIRELARFYSALAKASDLMKSDSSLVPVPERFQKVLDEAEKGFSQALDDDFNTAEAMARLFEVTRAFNNHCRKPGPVKPEQVAVAEVYFHWLRDKGQLMALFQEEPHEYLRLLDDMLLRKAGLSRQEIDILVAERTDARANRDFTTADQLRDELAKKGIAVHDTPEGSVWEVDK